MALIAQHGPARRIGYAAIRPRTVSATAFATPILIYFLALIMPSELAVNLFGLTLIPVRVALLVLFVPAVLQLLRTRELTIQPFDVFLVLALLWLLVALTVNNGFDKGAKFGGSLVLEALGGYVLARTYVRTYAQFTYAVRTYFMFVLVAASVAIPETFFGIQFAHDLAAAITGLPKAVISSEAGRLGLARANSTFDHPILYGTFCASALGLVWYLYSARPERWARALAIAGATLCAVSSASLLACLLIVAFIVWERRTRRIPNRAAFLMAGLAAIYLTIELVSNRSAIEVLISLVALDPWTAYYRILIWENASVDLANHPFAGVALNAWTRATWMTGSVDAFWLNMALMGGLPVVALLGLSVVTLLAQVHRRAGLGETRQRWQARLGWTATILVVCLQAFTVHYWGAMNSWFFFLVGLGAWMADASEGLGPARGAQAPARPSPPHRIVATRARRT